MKRTSTVSNLALACGAFAAAAAIPAAAGAQTATYIHAHLLKHGTATSPVAGPGTVLVQVYVKPDGSFTVQKILRSTNHKDDAAARQIASTSTYSPATRDGKPVAEYYTFKLNFTGGSGSASMADAAPAAPAAHGSLSQYAAMERAGNFAGAKRGVTPYLQSHPNDPQANLILAIADNYTSDYTGAAAAFEKAGSVPANMKTVAASAYQQAAAQAYRDAKYDQSVAYGRKSIALIPTLGAYNTVGNAEFQLKQYAPAVADLSKAQSMLAAAKVAPKQQAVVYGNLAAAYFADSQPDQGLAAAKQASTLDPSNASFQTTIENYYVGKANDERTAGNKLDAGATLEVAAGVIPKDAVDLYVQAAEDYATATAPDYAKAKTAVGKALALAPADARANYVEGIVLIRQNDKKNGIDALNKAQTAAKAGNDTALLAQIQAALKQASP